MNILTTILAVVLTVVYWRLYHKIFHVIYLGNIATKMIGEIFSCFLLACLTIGFGGMILGGAIGLLGTVLTFLLQVALVMGVAAVVIFGIYKLITVKRKKS